MIANKELAIGRVTLDGGDLNGSASTGKLGTLVVRATAPGAGLEVTSGAFADQDFQAVRVTPVPQLVAIPEPGTALLVSAGLLAIASRRRSRTARRPWTGAA